MTRILDFLQNITMGPAERHHRATVAQDKMLAYPLSVSSSEQILVADLESAIGLDL